MCFVSYFIWLNWTAREQDQEVSKPVCHHCYVYSKKTPNDGKKNCPKHVDFYSKNKFEKLLHVFGFIIRIYYDELQIGLNSPRWQQLESNYYYIWEKFLCIFGYATCGWRACCPHYVFLLITVRTDRMNSVHNTNMPHKLSIWQTVNDTSLFPHTKTVFSRCQCISTDI